MNIKTISHYSKLIITLSVAYLCISNTLFYAQKIESTPISGAERVVMYTYLKGVIGDKEIRGNVRAAGVKYNYNLLVYENGKRVLKKDMEISFNGEKYVPVDYFIKKDKIIAYFIAGSKNSTEVKLCLQEFNSNLEQVGDVIEIIELPKAIDPSKLLDNKSGGMFSDKDIQEQDLVAKYDKETGNILFCFSLQLAKEQNLSYCKIILIDNNYNILNNYDYKAASGENYIQATPQRIFENNDAMVSISEGVKVSEKNSLIETFEISKQVEVYVPANGNPSKELELMPDQSKIINIRAAENLTKEGHVSYGIVSTKFDEDKEVVTGYINLYTYNINNENLSRESYQYVISEILKDYTLKNASSFILKKIYNLSDDSILLWLTCSNTVQDFGNVFIKIDKNKQISWIKGFRKESINSIIGLSGALDFFDEGGDFNLMFNFPQKKFKNSTLETTWGKHLSFTPATTKLDLGSIPIIATVDLSTGEITMKKMAIENTTLGAVVISESEKMDNEGRYRMHMMINKKLRFVDIDFNAN